MYREVNLLKGFFFYALVFLICLGNISQVYAQSQQITAATATAVVQNTFTLTETVPPDAGVSVFIADIIGVDVSTYTLAPNGTVTITPMPGAQIYEIDDTGTAPGTIDVSGAAPNTTLNISFLNINNLVCISGCAGGNPEIGLGSFTTDVGFSPMTDALGNLTFNFGFTLTTIANPNQYEDGTYQGTFDIMVSY